MAEGETNTNPDVTTAPDATGATGATDTPPATGATGAGTTGAGTGGGAATPPPGATPPPDGGDDGGDDGEPAAPIEEAGQAVNTAEARKAETQPQERDPDAPREVIRSDLARGLLWLLTITVGAVIFFVGLGQVPSDVLTQSIFPSLVTLTGTALGFYFGAQTAKKD